MRYFSEKFPRYPEFTLDEISKTSDNIVRTVPSKGLVIQQIAQTLGRARFSPDIFFRDVVGPDIFRNLLYVFIESGIPYVAALGGKRHAVSIVGHEKPDISLASPGGVIDCSSLIPGLISCDDNSLPYSVIGAVAGKKLSFGDINAIVVPLYEKMYLDAVHLYQELLPEMESAFLPSGEMLVRRVLLASSNSFKRFLHKSSVDKQYAEVHLRLLMPKFIWLAEYAPVELYLKRKMSYRFIFDSTCLRDSYLEDIVLSNRQTGVLTIGDAYSHGADKREPLTLNKKSDMLYINNLKEV